MLGARGKLPKPIYLGREDNAYRGRTDADLGREARKQIWAARQGSNTAAYRRGRMEDLGRAQIWAERLRSGQGRRRLSGKDRCRLMEMEKSDGDGVTMGRRRHDGYRPTEMEKSDRQDKVQEMQRWLG
ncbi:hypothetical protein ACLOJK_007116 [Asimina triloba]